MIYQLHETHGKHIAYNTVEADANIENGWKTVTEEQFNSGQLKEIKKVFDASIVKIDTAKPAKIDHFKSKKPEFSRDDLAELHELKFGKKPHHKLSAAKIKAKLDE